MSFKFKRLKISDVILIEPKVFNDERGFFMEVIPLVSWVNPGRSRVSEEGVYWVILWRMSLLDLGTIGTGWRLSLCLLCTF